MHQHTARFRRKYQAIAIPKNRYVLAARGYASAHHDCVSGRGRVNVLGHHHANGHVNGRAHDRGQLRADGRGHGHHRVSGHVNGRRVRDRGHLRVDGRDRDHANDRVGAGADVHVHGCVRHHCNTASCFW